MLSKTSQAPEGARDGHRCYCKRTPVGMDVPRVCLRGTTCLWHRGRTQSNRRRLGEGLFMGVDGLRETSEGCCSTWACGWEAAIAPSLVGTREHLMAGPH